MKTAAAYIRVSTDDQIEYSPESQLKLLVDYAKKNDYILPSEFIFKDDGISGKDTRHRPAFNQMIALAKSDEHPIDTILVWKFSRFARNQEESIVIKNLLKKVNVEVRSISEPVDPDSAFGSLIERIIEWMDEYYLVNLSGEVKRGMLEKASRGEVVSVAPFGYSIIDGKLCPDENARYVVDMFNSFLSGEGQRRIAQRLGALGVRTRRGNLPDNRFVDYCLHNPVYIGKIRWSKEGRAASTRHYDSENILIYDGIHQPIIDEELFNAVQDRIEAIKKQYGKHQRREQPFQFMLKGLVRCSSCGATLCQGVKGSLQCHNYSKGTCHTSHSINIEKINTAVISGIETALATLNFNFAPSSEKKSNSTRDAERIIAAEERKLERIRSAFENGVYSLEEFAESKAKIQNTIKKLRSEISDKAETVPDLSSYAQQVSNVLSVVKDIKQSEAVKNDALRSIIDHIIFNRSDCSICITFYS